MTDHGASFGDDLRKSEDRSQDPVWHKACGGAFPQFDHSTINERGPSFSKAARETNLQLQGVDRTLYLDCGEQKLETPGKLGIAYFTITVDDKNSDYDDDRIFLEYVSNEVTGAPGWVCDPKKMCNYIAFNKGDKTAYWFPFPQLRVAWERHGADWRKTYGEKRIWNRDGGYNTLGVPVPAAVIYKAIVEALTVPLDAKLGKAASK